MLEVKDLSVRYGPIVAVDKLNLEVEKGQMVALIGTNGAGKSSTLKAITNSVLNKTGDVYFEGQLINKISTDKLPKLGLISVPEGRGIFPNLTVEENLLVAAKGAGKKFSDTEEKVYGTFPRLKERRKQMGWSLSGGEQQMLAIGRALMSAPKLLLLDEPSMGLSPLMTQQVFDVLLALKKQGMTILLVEQNAYEALTISDRAYIMETGNITLEGRSSELIDDPRVKDAYLGGDL